MIGTLSGTPPIDWANYPYAIEKTQKSTMFKFLEYYIRLLIFPHPLVYDYSYNVIPSGGKGDLLTWAGFFTFVGLIWLAWKGFVKRTLWGFGIFWFFVTMAPGLGFIWIRGGIFAERFTYAAVMGFGFVLVWALHKLLVRDRRKFGNTTSRPGCPVCSFAGSDGRCSWFVLVQNCGA